MSRPETKPVRMNPIPESRLDTNATRIERELILHSSYLYDSSPRTARTRADRHRASQDMRAFLFADKLAMQQVAGVRSLEELDKLRIDEQRIDQVRRDATARFAKRYSIRDEDPDAAIARIAGKADTTLDYATKDFPEEFTANGKDSKIRDIHHPVDLLLAATDQNSTRLDRFRALRKLHLMRIIATADAHRRTEKTNEKSERFKSFLEGHVLDPMTADDQIDRYIVSTHSTDKNGEFTTIASAVLTADEVADMPPLVHGQKLTRVQRRTFTVRTDLGDDVKKNIYFPVVQQNPYLREKADESIALKMMRKNKSLPAAAVDDQVGVIGVFETNPDARLFMEHMSQRSAESYGSLLQLEDIEDTLDGGVHNAVSGASVQDIRWLKVHFGMDDMRPEFIGFTKGGLTDYLYKEGQSHREYSVARSIIDGVFRRIAPPWMYGYSTNDAMEYVVSHVRRQVQDPNRINGNGEILFRRQRPEE